MKVGMNVVCLLANKEENALNCGQKSIIIMSVTCRPCISLCSNLKLKDNVNF